MTSFVVSFIFFIVGAFLGAWLEEEQHFNYCECQLCSRKRQKMLDKATKKTNEAK